MDERNAGRRTETTIRKQKANIKGKTKSEEANIKDGDEARVARRKWQDEVDGAGVDEKPATKRTRRVAKTRHE
jgi:hypothetical protein